MALRSRSLNSFFFLLVASAISCSDLPAEKHSHYSFPHDAYVELPKGKDEKRPYDVLGWVRAKAVYATMEQSQNDPALCLNYYNKAVHNLLKEARKVNADAVIQIRSVIMYLDGKFEEKPTPECADDGQEGEILLRGVAIKYKPFPTPSPSPGASPTPSASPAATP
jgi:hypothetical protein